jgi:hypothetical protein
MVSKNLIPFLCDGNSDFFKILDGRVTGDYEL